MARLLDAMRKQEQEHAEATRGLRQQLQLQPLSPPVPPHSPSRHAPPGSPIGADDEDPATTTQHVFKLHKEHGRLGMQLGVLADLRVVMVTQVSISCVCTPTCGASGNLCAANARQ